MHRIRRVSETGASVGRANANTRKGRHKAPGPRTDRMISPSSVAAGAASCASALRFRTFGCRSSPSIETDPRSTLSRLATSRSEKRGDLHATASIKGHRGQGMFMVRRMPSSRRRGLLPVRAFIFRSTAYPAGRKSTLPLPAEVVIRAGTAVRPPRPRCSTQATPARDLRR